MPQAATSNQPSTYSVLTFIRQTVLIMLLLLTALFLTAWFWRRNLRDSSLWMVLTYVGIGLVAWTDLTMASATASVVPKILKDFIMLGMVGFVQALAVKKQISIWTAVVLIFLMFAAVHVLDEMIRSEEGQQGSYLIELREGADPAQLESYAQKHGLVLERAFFLDEPSRTYLDNYYELNGADEASIAALAATPFVIYTEANETIQVEPLIAEEPSTGVRAQKGLSINDPFTGQQWVMEVLEMDDYYRLLMQQRPTKRAKVFILDTGVDASHEDLDDNYLSTEKKYDNDPVGHGTHCAGIAAGVTNNGLGIGSLAGTGDSPFMEVSSIKVLNAGGMGTQKTIIAGIIEAADEGADVISLSLGGRSNHSSQRAYSAAVDYAHRSGAIVVAAAGNSNRDAKDYAPANAEGMITVAAVDNLLLRAPFSNKVQNITMPIAAPGVGIYSTIPNNGYKAYSGTSMACPFVAGLLGVMKSIQPELTHQQAYDLIHTTGQDSNDPTTGRIVQPADALRALLRQ